MRLAFARCSFEKTLRQADEKIAAVDAGMDLRPVTTSHIQTHLNDFGLEKEFGTYGKIKGLSGGQKVSERSERALWKTSILAMNQQVRNGYP